jgi:hypothetical protein
MPTPLTDFSRGLWKTRSFARHQWKPRRATLSTNEKQGKGEKQNLTGPGVRGRYWRVERGKYKLANVNTSFHQVKTVKL